jgi:hypothetical protein
VINLEFISYKYETGCTAEHHTSSPIFLFLYEQLWKFDNKQNFYAELSGPTFFNQFFIDEFRNVMKS